MEPVPETHNGWWIVRWVRVQPDPSQVPDLAIAMVDRSRSIRDYSRCYGVIDMFCASGQAWGSESGAYDLSEHGAIAQFADRIRRRPVFVHMSRNPGLTWGEIAAVPWSLIPVTGAVEFTVHARDVAGKARDFEEFHTPEGRATASHIESWLMRYSEQHTHPGLRG